MCRWTLRLSEEDLIIEGEVNGTIHLKNNTLTIGPQGKVSAACRSSCSGSNLMFLQI